MDTDAVRAFRPSVFIKDVLLCSFLAFGGPEFHYAVLLEKLVVQKNYISEDEFLELIALSTFLPGPSSTQTVISIAYKKGGMSLALLALLVWVLPSIFLMLVLSFVVSNIQNLGFSKDVFFFYALYGDWFC